MTEQPALRNGSESAQIIIHRRKALADRARRYSIHLDNTAVATIADGQSIAIPVTAGTHELYASIDWCRSNKISLEIHAATSAEMFVSPRASGLLFAFYPILMFLPSRYLKLRRAR